MRKTPKLNTKSHLFMGAFNIILFALFLLAILFGHPKNEVGVWICTGLMGLIGIANIVFYLLDKKQRPEPRKEAL